jgi:hypothetical protein
VAHLAANIHGGDPAAFAVLKDTAADQHGRWLKVAGGLLAVLPAGLRPEDARHVIEGDFGAEVSTVELTGLSDRTLQVVFPELTRYLADDGLTLAAARLGCSRTTLFQHITTGHGCDLTHDDTAEAAFRKIVRGDTSPEGKGYGSDVRMTLANVRQLNVNPDLKESLHGRKGSQTLYRTLFGQDVVTLTGRARGRMHYSEARRAEYLDLADDALKAALYALVAVGFRVAGVVGEEVVIEMPADIDHNEAAERAARLAAEAAGDVLRGMPVPCSTRWLER